MAVGYSNSCKVCNSPHRAEIEKWVMDGMGYEEAADKSHRMYDLTVSKASIWRHMKNHFDLQAESRTKYAEKLAKEEAKPKNQPSPRRQAETQEEVDLAYEKSKLLMQQYVEESVGDITKLDNIINIDYSLYQRAAELMAKGLTGERPVAPKQYTDLMKILGENINKSLKTKIELLGTDAEGRKANAMETWVELVSNLDD